MLLLKRIVFLIITVAILGGGIWLFLNRGGEDVVGNEIVADEVGNVEVLGDSVEGRDIEIYTYGVDASDLHILFVGGVHGGYEWNSVLLAYELIDYLDEDSARVPENMRISIIPALNPDGLYEVVGKEGRFERYDIPEGMDTSHGRFNAREVDLNRNFDCKWQSESTWRNKVVSAGDEAFSEPEARVLRDFVSREKPDAVIFWHSSAGAVYASECEEGVLPETINIMNAYAKAAGYKAVSSFDAYPITGDAEGWLASIDIPSITVELTTHEDVEWQKNLRGIEALFQYYRQ